MPRLVRAMPLAFEASQKLDLPVKAEAMRLPDYLQEEERVLGALLDSRQLTKVSPGHYSYLVTSLQVFQLQVKPVVALQIESENGTLRMRALDCVLEGLPRGQTGLHAERTFRQCPSLREREPATLAAAGSSTGARINGRIDLERNPDWHQSSGWPTTHGRLPSLVPRPQRHPFRGTDA